MNYTDKAILIFLIADIIVTIMQMFIIVGLAKKLRGIYGRCKNCIREYRNTKLC